MISRNEIYFLISRNRIIDIKKSNSWYQETHFLISSNRILDIKKYLINIVKRRLKFYFLISRNGFLDVKNSIFWYQEIIFIFWYQEKYLLISRNEFLISRNISISWYKKNRIDIKKSNSWYQEIHFLILRILKLKIRGSSFNKRLLNYGNVFGPPFVDLFTYWARK